MRMTVMAVALSAACAGFAGAAGTDLELQLEGRRVRVKIDMPATKDGIDIFPCRDRVLDYEEYGKRIKQHGIALHAGDTAIVTKLKLSGDHLEVQIGGGGYGTFGNENAAFVYVPFVQKSEREKRLEAEKRKATDPGARSRLQEEIDELQRERARDNSRNLSLASMAREAKMERVYEKALQAGSRFNIRFERQPNGSDLSMEAVARVLDPYVELIGLDD